MTEGYNKKEGERVKETEGREGLQTLQGGGGTETYRRLNKTEIERGKRGGDRERDGENGTDTEGGERGDRRIHTQLETETGRQRETKRKKGTE